MRVETWQDGQLVHVEEWDDPPEVAIRRNLEDRARAALDTNRTFLALASPTNAQTLAQVRQLTRQNTALIRLLLNQLDSTD
jgi:hypothetical protein